MDEEPAPIDVAITVDTLEVVNHAMLWSGISPVRRLVLTPGVDLEDVTVTVVVLDGSGRPLTEPWSRRLDRLPAHLPQRFESVALTSVPQRMVALEEQEPASVVVEVRTTTGRCVERTPIRALSHHAWLFQPHAGSLSLELLAAFVLPHHPAITRLLAEARDLLRDRTGDPAMAGYQRGPDHVDAVVDAIYTAMQRHRIAYVTAPASWDLEGQRIRTPDDVLGDAPVGTCLDTTLVLAAALEEAGILPLLWVVAGHAFLGYWRDEPRQLPQVVADELGTVATRVDLDRMRVVETTLLTAAEPVPVAEACRRAKAAIAEAPEGWLHGVVDVALARSQGIGPLPLRDRDADGTVIVVEPRPPAPPPPPPPTTTGRTRAARPTAPPRVERWKSSLLDLTRRNRLISFTAGPSATTLLAPEGSLGEIEDRLHEGKRLRLRAADDLDAVQTARGLTTARDLDDDVLLTRFRQAHQLHTDLPGDPHLSRMRGLQRTARTLREESGSANLYLALGTLLWTPLDGTPLRSPVLLLPVTVTVGRRGETVDVALDEGGESTPNLCLLEKLRAELGVELPALAESVADDHGIDVDATFRAVRESLVDQDLPFQLRESLDLAVLQFATFVLWKDLDEHWERFTANSLVRHLVHTPTLEFADDDAFPSPEAPPAPDPDLDALAATVPVAADSSQLAAVADARAGRTFVLEGPPGTGKSQTITNLLAAAVADGKRVLFVAEKRAALDVVRARLDAVGLGDLSLDLHDKASRPAEVRRRLAEAMDAAVEPDAEGHRVADADLRAATRRLTRYRDTIHDTNAAGFSAYSARTAVLAVGDGPTLPVSRAFVTTASTTVLDDLRRRLRDADDAVWQARPRRHHPWGFVRGAAAVDHGALAAGVRVADGALTALDPAPDPLRRALATVTTTRELHLLAEVSAPDRPPLALLDEVLTPRWEHASTQLRETVARFVAVDRPVLSTATPEALALPLDDLHAEAVAADEAWFLPRKGKQLAVLERLRPALRAGVEPDRKQLPVLVRTLQGLRDEVRALRDHAVAVPGIVLDERWNPLLPGEADRPAEQIRALARAARGVSLAALGEGPFRDAVRAHLAEPPDPRWTTPLQRLAGGLGAALDAAGATDGAVGSWVVGTWRDGAGLVEAWAVERDARSADVGAGLVALRRWDELRALLAPFDEHGSPDAADAVLRGDVASDDVAAAAERGIARAALAERVEAAELATFDVVGHERAITRLDRSAREVREHLVEVLPRRVLDARDVDTDATRGRIGELRREVGRRRGLTIRALMRRYGDLITQLTPCVLVGPDSLARFVAPGTVTFDLVVFDEASQIRVADAVGAMGRARSVVVVGDSKQMPPTVFGGAGLDDPPVDVDDPAAEGGVPEDEESILSECVQARVPQRWLSWHYRSQDEALIAFSNRHYYEGRLASFPAPPKPGTGVSLRRVDGTFHRTASAEGALRTNPVEARALVDEVVARFTREELPSLGIVTFNAPQRDLVDEMLRAVDDPRLVDALDRTDGGGLFVKNLENVQGDERDTVLFSVAFARNRRGVLPLNFGPLNRAGGERRLNVAITRARREVIVFCSFDPADLRSEDTSATGVKHLRAYLDLAAGGVEGSGDTARVALGRDRHRDEIAARLRGRGFVVHTDVGLSEFRLDLTLALAADPEEPLVAVLLDGPHWARRRTAGDRDGLPPAVLERVLGWRHVARVWLPSWLRDPDAVLDDLAVQVEAAASGVEEPVVDVPPRAVPRETVAPATFATLASAPPAAPPRSAERLPGETVFRAWSPGVRGSRDVLDTLRRPDSAEQVRRALADAVAAEGPVESERLARAVASAFGLTRVSADRRDAILALLPRGLRHDRGEGFVWPAEHDPATWRGVRSSRDAPGRTLDEIALREIANAMGAVEAGTGGMAPEELYRETLAVFGWKRITPNVQERLDAAAREHAAP